MSVTEKEVININNVDQIDETQYLTFNIEEESYGLCLREAKEIIKPPKITNVPNTEDYILGVINLRGKVIPIIDLKKKLGLKDERKDIVTSKKRIIIINAKGIIVGIIVDQVKEVVNVNDDEIEDLSDSRRGLKEEFIKGLFTYKNKLIVIINIKEVLFAERQ